MPKDEFDFEDPLELNGVAFLTEDDTSAEMTECFAEEFMRMGYNHKQVLALFRNPHYVGPNMVLSNQGEQFVRDIIAETFARWGRPVFWTESQPLQSALQSGDCGARGCASSHSDRQNAELDEPLTDPMGNPIPKLR